MATHLGTDTNNPIEKQQWPKLGCAWWGWKEVAGFKKCLQDRIKKDLVVDWVWGSVRDRNQSDTQVSGSGWWCIYPGEEQVSDRVESETQIRSPLYLLSFMDHLCPWLNVSLGYYAYYHS